MLLFAAVAFPAVLMVFVPPAATRPCTHAMRPSRAPARSPPPSYASARARHCRSRWRATGGRRGGAGAAPVPPAAAGDCWAAEGGGRKPGTQVTAAQNLETIGAENSGRRQKMEAGPTASRQTVHQTTRCHPCTMRPAMVRSINYQPPAPTPPAQQPRQTKLQQAATHLWHHQPHPVPCCSGSSRPWPHRARPSHPRTPSTSARGTARTPASSERVGIVYIQALNVSFLEPEGRASHHVGAATSIRAPDAYSSAAQITTKRWPPLR